MPPLEESGNPNGCTVLVREESINRLSPLRGELAAATVIQKVRAACSPRSRTHPPCGRPGPEPPRSHDALAARVRSLTQAEAIHPDRHDIGRVADETLGFDTTERDTLLLSVGLRPSSAGGTAALDDLRFLLRCMHDPVIVADDTWNWISGRRRCAVSWKAYSLLRDQNR